jgi:hypothetical protein
MTARRRSFIYANDRAGFPVEEVDGKKRIYFDLAEDANPDHPGIQQGWELVCDMCNKRVPQFPLSGEHPELNEAVNVEVRATSPHHHFDKVEFFYHLGCVPAAFQSALIPKSDPR